MSLAAALLTSVTLALGLVLLGAGAPSKRWPRLSARLDPYLQGLEPRPTRLLDSQEPPLVPFPLLDRLLRPILEEGGQLVERCLGGGTGVARRLREAGLVQNVPRFRAEQMLWGLVGFTACTTIGLVVPAMSDGMPALAATAAGIIGLLGGVLGRDWRLTQQVARRHARMLQELPSLADLICLAVTAGEAPRAAIERAVATAAGRSCAGPAAGPVR
jgi:tight adherence protein C